MATREPTSITVIIEDLRGQQTGTTVLEGIEPWNSGAVISALGGEAVRGLAWDSPTVVHAAIA